MPLFPQPPCLGPLSSSSSQPLCHLLHEPSCPAVPHPIIRVSGSLSLWTSCATTHHPICVLSTVCLLAQEFPQAWSALSWEGLAQLMGSVRVCCICQRMRTDLRGDRLFSPLPGPCLPVPSVETAAGPTGQSPWVRETTVLCFLQK